MAWRLGPQRRTVGSLALASVVAIKLTVGEAFLSQTSFFEDVLLSKAHLAIESPRHASGGLCFFLWTHPKL